MDLYQKDRDTHYLAIFNDIDKQSRKAVSDLEYYLRQIECIIPLDTQTSYALSLVIPNLKEAINQLHIAIDSNNMSRHEHYPSIEGNVTMEGY